MDIVGNTGLMYAAGMSFKLLFSQFNYILICLAGNHPHTTNELLLHKADVTLTNEDGESAYTLAVKHNANLSQAVLENYLVSLLTS